MLFFRTFSGYFQYTNINNYLFNILILPIKKQISYVTLNATEKYIVTKMLKNLSKIVENPTKYKGCLSNLLRHLSNKYDIYV